MDKIAFTQIQFGVTGPDLVADLSIDDLRFAQAPVVAVVPEPGTLAILGFGLAGLMVVRHQARKSSSAAGHFRA